MLALCISLESVSHLPSELVTFSMLKQERICLKVQNCKAVAWMQQPFQQRLITRFPPCLLCLSYPVCIKKATL
jgi:hypothetical protein